MATTLSTNHQAQNSGVVRFHLSLNVDDLARSVEFFGLLFDTRPARHERDYAKFELDTPPLVLSLEPAPAPRGGKLNHLGFRLASAEALVALQRRLEMHGLTTAREEGVECCYSKQTKFWVTDPDGNLWELYVMDEAGEHRIGAAAPQAVHQVTAAASAPSLWAHRLGDALPERIMAETGGVDEVLLQGTFNARTTKEVRQAILTESLRILTPGGRLTLHQLSAAMTLESLTKPLPGPAAVVDRVPSAVDLVKELNEAGFIDIYFDKLDEAARFTADGVECRETRISGHKPQESSEPSTARVLYRGPFQEIVDDGGLRFKRGQWTKVDKATLARVSSDRCADQFVIGRRNGDCE